MPQIAERGQADLRWGPAGLRRVILGAGYLVMAAATLSLCGWVLGVGVLKSALPNLVEMKANTAIGFLLAGLALVLMALRRARWAGVLGLLLATLGAATAFEYLAGFELGIDEILFRDTLSQQFRLPPGRMALVTAIGFILTGVSLPLARWRPGVIMAQVLVFLVMLLALFSLAGYILGEATIFRWSPFTSLALPTVACFLVLGAGILAGCGARGPMAIFLAPSVGGVVLRRLLPASVVVTLTLSWLSLIGLRWNLYGEAVGLALYALMVTAVLAAVIWVNAAALHRGDVRHARTERELSRKEQELSLFANSSVLGLITADIHGGVRHMNDEFLRLIGYSREEFLESGLGWTDLTPPEWIEADRRAISEASQRGICTPYEKQYVRKDGSRIDLLVGFTLVGPTREEAVAFLLDITERKQAEAALRRGEDRYRSLIEGLPQLVWTTTADGACDYLSRQWCDFTGLTEPEQLGVQWVQKVIHPEDRTRVWRCWVDAVAGRSLYDLEYRLLRRDGEYRWFKARGIPFRDESGRIVKWFGTCTDIDAQVRAEEALRETDLRKDEFLAMLAHELRNPLAAVRGAIEIGREGANSDEDPSWAAEVLDRQVSHLTHLIDDLLDVARISRGKIELRRKVLDLRGVVQRAAQATQPLMDQKKHTLTVALADLPLWVDADATRMEQVVVNLLTNAAKYTPDGGQILLDVRTEGAERVLRVRDNGVGIPPEMRARVFDLFTQVDRTLERSQGGLGIGLTLVQRLLEMHGGSIAALGVAPPGTGTEILVRLPAAAPEAGHGQGSAPSAAAQSTPSRRILVVDDNLDAARGLFRLLSRRGHEVVTAPDGPTGLDAFRAFRPEVVLLDIGLPGLDGYEVARRIRADDAPPAASPLLVAISGYGLERDRIRSRDAGFDHHLIKPVDFEALYKILNAHPPALATTGA